MAKSKKVKQFPQSIFIKRDGATGAEFYVAEEDGDLLVETQPTTIAEYQLVNVAKFKLEAVEVI